MDSTPVLVAPRKIDPSIVERVDFVQADFLRRWPFDDQSFDFVRIANIGLDVPEDRWFVPTLGFSVSGT